MPYQTFTGQSNNSEEAYAKREAVNNAVRLLIYHLEVGKTYQIHIDDPIITSQPGDNGGSKYYYAECTAYGTPALDSLKEAAIVHDRNTKIENALEVCRKEIEKVKLND